MNRPTLAAVNQAISGRSRRERIILLVTVLVFIGYLWLTLVFDPFSAARQQARSQLQSVDARIEAQESRYQALQASLSEDPEAAARAELSRLQAENRSLDDRLEESYGQLILPRQMSRVLSRILQQETELSLVSLENRDAETIMTARLDTLPGTTQETGGGEGGTVEVFRHGLTMVFEGGFRETIRFLRHLESLESSFFWENLVYEVTEYPNARITLDIFTLSTQRGWVGV